MRKIPNASKRCKSPTPTALLVQFLARAPGLFVGDPHPSMNFDPQASSLVDDFFAGIIFDLSALADKLWNGKARQQVFDRLTRRQFWALLAAFESLERVLSGEVLNRPRICRHGDFISIDQSRLRALEHVYFLVGTGMTLTAARHRIAGVYGVHAKNLEHWERGRAGKPGIDPSVGDVKRSITLAKEAGAKEAGNRTLFPNFDILHNLHHMMVFSTQLSFILEPPEISAEAYHRAQRTKRRPAIGEIADLPRRRPIT
jgi:hypothetical protein